MKILFDETTHTYKTENGENLLGVTRILRLSGLVDTTWFNATATLRGTAVHKACELRLNNKLDEESVCAEITGYLQGFDKFLTESKFKVQKQETIVVSLKKGYAGRIDFLGMLNKRRALVDIKTGHLPEWTAEQTAGYAECLNYPARFGLELRGNGTYSLREFADPNDYANWNACLLIAKMKIKRGMDQ